MFTPPFVSPRRTVAAKKHTPPLSLPTSVPPNTRPAPRRNFALRELSYRHENALCSGYVANDIYTKCFCRWTIQTRCITNHNLAPAGTGARPGNHVEYPRWQKLPEIVDAGRFCGRATRTW